MHQIQLREIIRDAEVAHAIRSVVFRHRLTLEATINALMTCSVPRAAAVAQIAMDRSFA